MYNNILIHACAKVVLLDKLKCPTCTGYELAMIRCNYMYIHCKDISQLNLQMIKGKSSLLSTLVENLSYMYIVHVRMSGVHVLGIKRYV